MMLHAAADGMEDNAGSCDSRVVCVTGGSGYLGLEIVAQLLAHDANFSVKTTVRSVSNEAKVRPLLALPGAAERLTILEADLLGGADSFRACAENVEVLFHTASPFRTSGVIDAESELIRPAVEGTEAVMQAAVAAGVGRVVLTSSIAAIMGKVSDKASCFDEDDWNWSSSLESADGLDLYRLSKKLAEKRAWEIAEGSVGFAGRGVDLAVVCPSVIVGPPRTPRVDRESLALMAAVLRGGAPARGPSPMVDVRDAAAAHLAAAWLSLEDVGTDPPPPPLSPEESAQKNHSADGGGGGGGGGVRIRRFLASTESAVDPSAVCQAADRALRKRRDQNPKEAQGVEEGGCPKHFLLESRHEPQGKGDHGGRYRIFCSKNAHALGVNFRPIDESLEDMADVMLRLSQSK